MPVNALGFHVAPPLSLTGIRPEDVARHARECRAAVERIGDPLSVMAPRPFRERWRMVSDGARWAAGELIGWAEEQTGLELDPKPAPESGPERFQVPHFVAARVAMPAPECRALGREEWALLIADYLAAVASCYAVCRPLATARLGGLAGPWRSVSAALVNLRSALLDAVRAQHPGWDEAVAALCAMAESVPPVEQVMAPLLATVDRAEVERLGSLTMADVGNPDGGPGRAWDIAELAEWRL